MVDRWSLRCGSDVFEAAGQRGEAGDGPGGGRGWKVRAWGGMRRGWRAGAMVGRRADSVGFGRARRGRFWRDYGIRGGITLLRGLQKCAGGG